MNTEYIGKRLALLREELACPGEQKWSQARMAAETGLTQNVISNMELSGSARIEAFMDYLIFYQKRGYNLNWILTPENHNISKMVFNEAAKVVDVRTVLVELENIKQTVDNEINRVAQLVGH